MINGSITHFDHSLGSLLDPLALLPAHSLHTDAHGCNTAAAAWCVTGPAELREAFRFVYELAGRSPSGTSAGSGLLGGLLGSLFGGGARSRSGGDPGFPAEDVKVLQGLNELLIRAKVVFTDAEQREGAAGPR